MKHFRTYAVRFGIASVVIFMAPAKIHSATIHVPKDYPAIQQAIDAASKGDTVIVDPGTYVENIDFLGKTITLKSTSGAASTIIDGNQSGSVVTFSGGEGEDCVLEGFTLTNGTGTYLNGSYPYGGGALSDALSKPAIRGNTITGNTASFGAGIYCRFASPLVEGNTIACNSANGYGNFGGALCCASSNIVVRDNTITGNEAECSSVFYFIASAAAVRDNTITGNESKNSEILYSGGNCDLTIENNIISGNIVHGWHLLHFQDGPSVRCTGNTITDNATGRDFIYAHNTPLLILEENLIAGNRIDNYYTIMCYQVQALTIHGNTIQENSGPGICSSECQAIITNNVITGNEGSGIECSASDPLIEGNRILNNLGRWGGGLHLVNCSATVRKNTISGNLGVCGGGVYLTWYDTSVLTDNCITGNSAYSGGGIYCEFEAAPVITNNLITANSAIYGGGAHFSCVGPAIHLMNNLIAKNKAIQAGGGIYTQATYEMLFTNDTIAGNIAQDKGGGIFFGSEVQALMTNAILWNNDALAGPEIWLGDMNYPSTLDISYTNLRGGAASVHVESFCTLNLGSGMIDADPLFAESAKSDYHLSYPSPSRDTGDNGAPELQPEDFEGDPRVAYGAVDMGCDEFYTHLYHSGYPFPGGYLNVKVTDLPGTAPVLLYTGSGLLDPPQVTKYGNWYLELPLLLELSLGAVPMEGITGVGGKIPVDLPVPFVLPLQALAGNQLTHPEFITIQW